MPLCRQNDSKLTRAAARILRRFAALYVLQVSHGAREAMRFDGRARAARLRSVTNKGKRLVLPRLDVPATFLAVLLCFSAAASRPPPRSRHRPPPPIPNRRRQRPRQILRRRQRLPFPPIQQRPPRLMRQPISGTTRCRSSASRSIRAGFTHFDWVNPDAPKGGTSARLRRRLVRQPQPVHGEGRPGRRSRPHLRFAARRRAPTSRRPSTASSPSGSPIRRTIRR